MSRLGATKPKVLLGVTGGIAAVKAAELTRRLIDQGCEVQCALTRSAASFVTPLSLEVLSGQAVYEQEYLTATGSGEESHIVAAQWADVICFAPATAHLLARLALGLADDFLTTTVLAFTGPVVIAPAMHSDMWAQPTVVSHVATLTERGVRFVGPVEGPLASGEVGIGRLADPLAIAEEVTAAARSQPTLAGRRILISAGPTYEPLDPVRFLGNRSSGKMGFSLAAEAARRGAKTTLVAGPVNLATPAGVERIDVQTALEMRDAVHQRAPVADLIVMTAAVADYRPVQVAEHKHKKSSGVPTFQLTENPDILAGLEEVAPQALRVGFAAETEVSEQAAYGKLRRKGADLLVWNDVSRSDIGFGADHNEVTVYRREGEPERLARRPKHELAGALMAIFADALEARADATGASANG
ncbi:MAG: bifunctional phosphopantothenoylcysteine decarboxylase/phosphopantothenate--cysteine ligase CoaBC [Acidobacteriota bacterium]